MKKTVSAVYSRKNGLIIEVNVEKEALSAAFATVSMLLLRACYHLGKRHVPVQISESRVSYLHDIAARCWTTWGMALDLM